MHDHVDLVKRFERLFKEILDIRGLRHIRLHGDGFSAGVVNFGYDCFSFSWVAGIMHRDCEAVACQSFCHYTSDSTRPARDDRAFVGDVFIIQKYAVLIIRKMHCWNTCYA